MRRKASSTRRLDLVPDSESTPGGAGNERGQHTTSARSCRGMPTGRRGRIERPWPRRRSRPSGRRKTCSSGWEEFPEVPQYREELAVVSANLGIMEQGLDQKAQAMDDLRRAEALSDRLVVESPTVPKYHLQSAIVCQRMAEILAQKDPACRRRARKSVERLASLQPLYPEMPNYLRGPGASLPGIVPDPTAKGAARRSHRGGRAGFGLLPGGVEIQSGESPLPLGLVGCPSRNGGHPVGSRRHCGAAKDAEELPRLQPDTQISYMDAACLLIKCAGHREIGGSIFMIAR